MKEFYHFNQLSDEIAGCGIRVAGCEFQDVGSEVRFFSIVDVRLRIGQNTLNSAILDKTKRTYFAKLATKAKSDTINLQSSIFNLQFPDKSGFTLRYNRLVRVRHFSYELLSSFDSESD